MSEKKIVPTEKACLAGITKLSEIDQLMVHYAEQLNSIIKTLLHEGASKIEIAWIRQFDAHESPMGDLGYFRVNGERL